MGHLTILNIANIVSLFIQVEFEGIVLWLNPPLNPVNPGAPGGPSGPVSPFSPFGPGGPA